jgi:hypothetical protein
MGTRPRRLTHRRGRPPRPEEPVPTIRPFRALRYEAEAVGDLALVTSPPYDIIGPD